MKILTELSNPARGNVELTGKWLVHGKQSRQSIEDLAAYRSDHDIELLPFAHLSDWDHSLLDDLSNEPTTKKSMLSLLREHGPGFEQHQHRLKKRFGLNDLE